MKKFIPIFSFAALLTACNSAPKDNQELNLAQTQQALVLDTAGLANYQHWKAQNEMVEIREEIAAPLVKSAPVRKQAVAKASVPRKTAVAPRTVVQPVSQPSVGSSEASGSGEGTIASGDAGEIPQEAKKPGVSNAKKGAVIGGVAGGAAGAVINKKNRVVGGVVGAVVGAAVGYGVGKMKDKKSAENFN